MTTQTIEVEGLPEGWKAVAFRIPDPGEHFFIDGNIELSVLASLPYLIVEKIQPRRIVLEETVEINLAYNSAFNTKPMVQNSKYKWREVKETDIPLTKEEPNVKIGVSQGDGDEPKLSLSVDQCKQLCSRNFNLVQEIMSIAREFIKDK